MPTLYLASQSPRRAALIKLLGVRDVRIQPSDIDEQMDPALTPAENVRLLAEHKALHLAEKLGHTSDALIIGSDTTVAIDNEVLNKPEDADEAERMLRKLSGRTHIVHTGVAIVRAKTRDTFSFVESTQVTFRDLKTDEIRAYIATGSPMDKAGAYGIQEDFGAVFVQAIQGDYYAVVGLPVCRLYVELQRLEPSLFAQSATPHL